jgi:acyl carrier protein
VMHATTHLAAMYGTVQEGAQLNVAGLASVSFDVFVNQVLGMAAFGHRLVVFDEGERQDLPGLVSRSDNPGTAIGILDCATSQLEALVDLGILQGQYPPRLVIFGGERCSRHLWAALRSCPGLEAFNVYGVTECTVDSTAARVRDYADPIAGRATGGSRIYIVDDLLQLLPSTFVGEICIGGAGVGRGYAAQPALSAERFVPDPYGVGRMYRTGDRGRMRPDGQLEFWGRTDEQVKIRGHRIELGEVEAALLRQPGVIRATCAVFEKIPGSGEIVGYVVPKQQLDVDISGLKHGLAKILPAYMVPSQIISLQSMPLTANGKIDRARLPAPERKPAADHRSRTDLEQRICDHFAEVLNLVGIGIDDNFFDKGGNSLMAGRLINHVRAAFECDIPISVLFRYPTPAAFATQLGDALGKNRLPPLVRRAT